MSAASGYERDGYVSSRCDSSCFGSADYTAAVRGEGAGAVEDDSASFAAVSVPYISYAYFCVCYG